MEGCRNTNGKSMAAAALTTSGGGSRTARFVGIDSLCRAFRARRIAAGCPRDARGPLLLSRIRERQ